MIKMYFIFQKAIQFIIYKFLKEGIFKVQYFKIRVYRQVNVIIVRIKYLFNKTHLQPQMKMLCVRLVSVIFCIGLLVFSLRSSFINLSESESRNYWNDTKLNFSTLHSVINEETCYAELNNFLGCMQALFTLLTTISDKNIDLVFTEDQIKKGINFLSDIKIQPSSKKDFQDISDVLKDMKISMTKKIQTWRTLYHQTRKNHIRFYHILREILLEVITHSESSLQSSLESKVLKISKNFYHKRLIAQSINGYLSVTHSPHDHLIPLELMKDRSKASEGEYSGVGLILFQIQQHLVVKRVLENGPAFRAGLKSGDIISKVQGQDISQMNLSDSSNAIGRVNSKVVHLEVLREGVRRYFTLNKEVIKTDNIETEYIKDNNKKWGLIKLSSFYKVNTCAQVEKAIYKFQEDPQVSGLVVDLRNNPGGLVDEALCTADLFLPKDQLMLEVRPFDPSQSSQFNFSLMPQVTDLPLVILINAGSASSAEIVAGILRDHNRGVLIGERTFGKGTILYGTSFQYPQYPNLIHYQTAAKFYFPSRRSNHILGIIPDHIVKFENSSLVPFREGDLFAYQLPSFQLALKNQEPLSPIYSRQSDFKSYQNCLQGLKTSQNQRAKTLATTVLRCVTAQKNQLARSS